MSLPQFTDILSLSNLEILDRITETENELYNLRVKKAMQRTVKSQNFKSHEIKYTKRNLAHLKTLLTLRLENVEQIEQIFKELKNVS